MSLSIQEQKLYKSGLVYALVSYAAWGVFPLYWKLLKHVPPQQILAHRIVWSLLFLFLILAWRRDRVFIQYLTTPRILGTLLLTSSAISGTIQTINPEG